MSEQFTTTWLDHGREPECSPDPAYPNGKDVRLGLTNIKTCIVTLPYPARRCGLYVVVCAICKVSAGITTAGRPDDPKSVEIPCDQAQH